MPTLLRCLHDTRLQPPDFAVTLGPVDAVPVSHVVGGRTRFLLPRSHLLLLLRRFSSSLVMKDHAEVCPLSRGAMSSRDSVPIRPITRRPSLSPHSSTRTANGFPRGWPALIGQRYGLTVFHIVCKDGLG